ncbi:unnamed protein product [Allacma fusca]|uniref:Uncharacterized protein n=1 Tax=Allacma fusca TaxID=39272 RepID=A0A8J2LKQ9_9HEXA|nr:unnamed protein product [Allacma fusca]
MNSWHRLMLNSKAVMGVQLQIPVKPPRGTQRDFCNVCVQLSQYPNKPDQESARHSRTRVKCDQCDNFVCETHSQRKKICEFLQPANMD